jgi:ABC-type branched-subunit amino acid transport system substrate-binding protein
MGMRKQPKFFNILFHSAWIVTCLLVARPAVAQEKKTNKVALIMPFCAKQILQYPGAGYEELGGLCREYYQGMLLALDSFELAKIPVHLNVLDTENDSMTLIRLLQRPEVQETDLIIGPVRSGGNKVLSNFVKSRRIFHVSPLMTLSRSHVSDPYWISCNPDLPTYGDFLYNYIVKHPDSSANIIVVSDKSSYGKSVIEGIKPYGSGNNKTVKITYLEYPSKTFDLIKLLSPSKPNHIIIPSNNEGHVNAILRTIKDTNDGFDISCYGFPKWLEFKNSDHVVFERMKVHIATPFYIDYSDEAVKQFVYRYRDRYYCEPTESAFKGYDQALVLIDALNCDGRPFIYNLGSKSVKTLHTTFEFRCTDKSPSFQNRYLNLITLENLKQKKVN